MGVGKTTVCQQLKRQLKNSVFLDGDWCWDARPFQVTDETKIMVVEISAICLIILYTVLLMIISFFAG